MKKTFSRILVAISALAVLGILSCDPGSGSAPTPTPSIQEKKEPMKPPAEQPKGDPQKPPQ